MFFKFPEFFLADFYSVWIVLVLNAWNDWNFLYNIYIVKGSSWDTWYLQCLRLNRSISSLLYLWLSPQIGVLCPKNNSPFLLASLSLQKKLTIYSTFLTFEKKKYQFQDQGWELMFVSSKHIVTSIYNLVSVSTNLFCMILGNDRSNSFLWRVKIGYWALLQSFGKSKNTEM